MPDSPPSPSSRGIDQCEPIENHGLIGNMRSAALVSMSGEIDFFCYPEFDSPTVFASLLDREKGGSFTLRPEADGFVVNQLYVPDTNVLVTQFLFEDGIAEITDFMPVGNEPVGHSILRRLVVLEGKIRFRVDCQPRFDYARCAHRVAQDGNGVTFTPENSAIREMKLRASIPLEATSDGANATFDLVAGQHAYFVFGDAEHLPEEEDLENSVSEHLKTTCSYWKAWSAKSTYRGRWREIVQRSALVLKLLTSEKYGSLIAAPTFSLPEQIGGGRNWDYRYTWLRDASFTLYALSRLGYIDESKNFNRWMKERLTLGGENGPLQTMYGIDGRTNLDEIDLPHLSGYRESRPVRIGNAAYKQLQLDIYGELFDATYLSSKYGDGISYEAWEAMKKILRWLADHWQDADEGIWEVRGGRKEFLHSRLMCWVAFDRAVRLGGKRSLSGPFDWMEKARDDIAHDINVNFWNEERQTFVQFKGSTAVDASTLLMPLMRFISPSDPRWIATLKVIQRELTVDTLVKRYLTESGVDGLEGGEGSFTACSFWFVEALARTGQVAHAHELFEKLMSYSNHLGLYPEELGPKGEHLGNFPQALTHLALISAATYLDRKLSGKREAPWS
ncbi:MAG: glycoside hydrolase family 15 protein [Polyangiaceae bacterium]